MGEGRERRDGIPVYSMLPQGQSSLSKTHCTERPAPRNRISAVTMQNKTTMHTLQETDGEESNRRRRNTGQGCTGLTRRSLSRGIGEPGEVVVFVQGDVPSLGPSISEHTQGCPRPGSV